MAAAEARRRSESARDSRTAPEEPRRASDSGARLTPRRSVRWVKKSFVTIIFLL